MGAAIEVDEVTKRFKIREAPARTIKERALALGRQTPSHDFWALEGISLDIAVGETVGLIGHNGSGKSTLLKCIGGILQPTSGTIRTVGRLASLLELGAGFHPDLTGRENVYLNGSILGLSHRDLDVVFDEIVGFAELERFIDNPVKTYSSGMFVRLGFAVAVNVDPDILLVDEVLAVGDESFQARCIDRVRQFQTEGRTIVVVTHGVDLVRQLCDRAAVLRGGRLVALGEPSDCIRHYRDSMLNRAAWYDDPDGGPVASGEPRHLASLDVQISSVAVQPIDGGAVDAPVRSGEGALVHVEWVSDQRVDDAVGSFVIFDPEGRTVYGTNTHELGVDIDPLRGRGRLTYELPRLPLMGGVYTLSVGVHTRDGRTVHDVAEHELTVEADGRGVGLVDLAPRVHVEQLDPTAR